MHISDVAGWVKLIILMGSAVTLSVMGRRSNYSLDVLLRLTRIMIIQWVIMITLDIVFVDDLFLILLDAFILALLLYLYWFLRKKRQDPIGKQVGAKARALRDKLVKSARKLADGVRIPLPAVPQPG